MASSIPKLHTYFRSSSAWRVRIALAWKQIEYEAVPVHLLNGEQKSEEYTRINPLQQVPALLIDGHVITQSLAIMEYLEEKFPQHPILPQDTLQRARVREVSEIIGSGIQPLHNLSVLNKVSDETSKKVEFAAFWIAKAFDALEVLLESTSGKYCVGDEVTMADFCLVPQVAAAERFKVPLEKYVNIRRVNAALKALQPFQKADQFAQSDCPEDLKPKN
ncbi:Maleylacetoacetate isomerase [Hypsibius exemplaris]|uniref:maleylacetoacetate isomerase n=1 Tax=Hypsibius exemplaris TaxID=2072580 RepID=A0A1W0X5M7_HYPEX|nr:Maleylacetoacetate isomerase [Hypsibius exemplaris]